MAEAGERILAMAAPSGFIGAGPVIENDLIEARDAHFLYAQGARMEFDRFAVVLLILRPDAPQLDARAEDALQDAHLAFLTSLHQAGALVAAGPLFGAADREFRGLSIFDVEPEQALALALEDPGVRAGRYAIQVFPCMVPKGAVSFAPARFPRSAAEAGTRRNSAQE